MNTQAGAGTKNSILSPDALHQVSSALQNGPIFGFHMYLRAGRGGSTFVFSDFDSFVDYVTSSRYGDIFLIWSVGRLVLRNQFLVSALRNHGVKNASSWEKESVSSVRDYFASERGLEVFLISSSSHNLRSAIYDCDDFSEIEHEIHCAASDESIYLMVFPFTAIDTDQDCLVSGKRPDELGNVPEGGAY